MAAGGQDVFEIFLWSMKTGKLLEILSGHEGPVVSVSLQQNIKEYTFELHERLLLG